MLQFLLSLTGREETLVLSGITYPNSRGYLSDINLMQAGLGNYQFNPVIWTIQDKTFISVSDNSSPNKYYIYVFDHFTNKISNAIDTALIAEGSNNIHHVASIIGTYGGKLLITETSLHGTSGNWKHSLSGPNYNINNFNSWTDTTINHSTYSQLKRFVNNNIYDIVRTASISGNFAYTDIYKSDDNGFSFSLTARILDWGTQAGNNRYIPYHSLIYSTDDVIRLFINRLDYTYNGSSTFIGGPVTYYLESDDGGVTWKNINNSFSKNVVSTAALTFAEMNTNMIMWDLTTTSNIIRANGACLFNGLPYIIGGSGSITSSPLALYSWNGSSWEQKIITVSGRTILGAYATGGAYAVNNSTGIYQNGDYLDLVCMELISGYNQMSLFRSLDNGYTWNFIKQITNQNYNHAQARVNYNIGVKKLVSCEYFDSTNYHLFVDLL